MEPSGIEQSFGDQRGSTCRIEIGCSKAASWLEICEQGNLAIDLIEVVNVQLDSGFTGDGKEMQHGVRRAPGGGDSSDGVLQRLSGDNPARAQILLQELHYHLAALKGDIVLPTVHGRNTIATHG